MAALGIPTYAARITPALALCALLSILWVSYSSLPRESDHEGAEIGSDHANGWQWMLSAYALLVHIVTTLFAVRTFRTVGHVIARIEETAGKPWLKRNASSLQPSLRFAIIIPSYKETTRTLQTTLSVLASHPQARSCYHVRSSASRPGDAAIDERKVYLAMEDREIGSREKAESLQNEFGDRFHEVSITIHPGGIVNEAPGKSSNESWAGQQIVKDYSLSDKLLEVIVTTMDADSHLSWRYFAQIAKQHLALSEEEHGRSFYVCPVVFDRNSHQVPLLVRIADIFWAGAGISTMYAQSSVCIPTSVYSMPLSLLKYVGGWDSDARAIGEDMHMFLKCYFALDGNLRPEVIYAAASQCNVCSELAGVRGYYDGIRVRYQQAKRHMWGMLDTGFAVELAAGMVIYKLKWWTRNIDTVTTSVLRRRSDARWRLSQGMFEPHTRIQKRRTMTVFLRLWEAHMIPLHLALVLTMTGSYKTLHPKNRIPMMLNTSLDICSVLRLLGFLIMIAFLYRYNRYHRLCLRLRMEDAQQAGCEGGSRGERASSHCSAIGMHEAILFPLGGMLFGALPALQATVMHVFTNQLHYVVSGKPLLEDGPGDHHV